MNRNTLKAGTRVTFYPVMGAAYTAEGGITKSFTKSGERFFEVAVLRGTGSGKVWTIAADDVISAEPTPGAWGQF